MMKMKDNNSSFQTSDFTLATFLYSQGIILRDLIASPGDFKRKVFVFDEPPEELLALFQSGKAEINVLAYENAQNALRSMLRN